MPKSQLLVGTGLQGFYLIVLQDEVAVRPQQIVGHQIGVMRRREHLTIEIEQLLTNLKRQFEVIEGIKLIDEDK